MRNRFNIEPNSLDFLFLQRSNFNGMIRFSKNGYNVPFGRKPERFRPALITKIVNQVAWVQKEIQKNNWIFIVSTWQESLDNVKKMILFIWIHRILGGMLNPLHPGMKRMLMN